MKKLFQILIISIFLTSCCGSSGIAAQTGLDDFETGDTITATILNLIKNTADAADALATLNAAAIIVLQSGADIVLTDDTPSISVDADTKALSIGTDTDNTIIIYGANHSFAADTMIFGVGGSTALTLEDDQATAGVPFDVTGLLSSDIFSCSGSAGITGKLTVNGGYNDGSSDLGATFAEIDAAADGIGVTIPRQKVLEIGAWNMDSTSGVSIAHGLTLAKIVGARIVIINDLANHVYPISYGSTAGGGWSADATNIDLVRTASGSFDNSAFDDAVIDRGYIVIDYID